MNCGWCDDLDRPIAAARDRRHFAKAEAEINATDHQDTILALQMIAHLGSCPYAKGKTRWERSVIQL